MKTLRLQTVHRPVAEYSLLLQTEDPFLARDHISLGSFTSQTFLQAWQTATEEAATDKFCYLRNSHPMATRDA